MKITGITDEERAREFFENSWRILEYIVSNYSGKVHVGARFAYNSAWMSFRGGR